MTVAIPPGLRAQATLGPAWSAWLDGLPRLAQDLLEDWELTADGPATHGYCSLVLPVRTGSDEPAALKITVDADVESRNEALALRVWDGRGAVRLLRADPRRRALLLERLSTLDLGETWDEQACEVVAGAYGRLHVPAPPRFEPLTGFLRRWLADLSALLTQGSDAPLPRRYVDQVLALGRELMEDPASTGRLIHGDLHYGNVLAGEREPWLVIDPKPMSGDPHYEPAPMLINRMDELRGPGAVGSVRDGLRRRFHALVDAGGLDEDRARSWVVVRMVLNAGWAVADARGGGHCDAPAARDHVTRCLTVAKAVQE